MNERQWRQCFAFWKYVVVEFGQNSTGRILTRLAKCNLEMMLTHHFELQWLAVVEEELPKVFSLSLNNQRHSTQCKWGRSKHTRQMGPWWLRNRWETISRTYILCTDTWRYLFLIFIFFVMKTNIMPHTWKYT